ncbi:MAG: BamA/OMP85 family outer membrane protein, partial [Puniceicoccales bacterium]
RMKSSQARLENTRFFDEVRLSPEATNIPGRRNLRITVKEGQTGNLTFGAGFSSVESIVGFVELSQSNFDIFSPGSWFQGGGQKFRLRISIGSQSNQVLLAFEEPWLWERELAGGFELYRTESNYLSVNYNELRMGATFYLRKRLFELVEGKLSYTVEDVNIKDVSTGAPLDVQQQAGNTSVSKVGFELLRDTRNNLIFPDRGTRLESLTEFAGGPLGGQTDYVRQTLSGAMWIKTFDWANQVISFRGRTGTVIPYDNNIVPFFDQYYLGGPYSLRGFQFRDVGPKQTDKSKPGYGETLGGNTMAFASIEYTFQILEPLRFALFYDWGYVNSGDLNWDPSAYNDDYGFGFRILLMGAPLNIDFGFPLTSDEFNDDGMQFNFSFGTVF